VITSLPNPTPDVSIVLVTYNRAQFLPRTLNCILNQTYPHFELFICDDCSTDTTPEICRSYAARDSRITYLRNRTNLAMPGNLNSGISHCSGQFLAILHDGDIYQPTLLERWRAALIAHPTAGFVFNIYRHLSPDGKSGVLTDTFPAFIPGKTFLEKICFRDKELDCPVWGTVMARRAVLEEMSLFNARYSFWSDADMWFRIAEKYDVAFVPEPLIDLPSRQVMPHLFQKTAFTTHATIFSIFWAARCRHYRGRLGALAFELARQTEYFLSSKTRSAARRFPLGLTRSLVVSCLPIRRRTKVGTPSSAL
jgi:glycosyltransferase involved in cell wall biosynthesis